MWIAFAALGRTQKERDSGRTSVSRHPSATLLDDVIFCVSRQLVDPVAAVLKREKYEAGELVRAFGPGGRVLSVWCLCVWLVSAPVLMRVVGDCWWAAHKPWRRRALSLVTLRLVWLARSCFDEGCVIAGGRHVFISHVPLCFLL